MRVWFGGVILVAGVSFVSALVDQLTRPSSGDLSSWTFLLMPPGVFIVCYLLLRLARHFAREETQFLTDFLRHTLDASDDA